MDSCALPRRLVSASLHRLRLVSRPIWRARFRPASSAGSPSAQSAGASLLPGWRRSEDTSLPDSFRSRVFSLSQEALARVSVRGNSRGINHVKRFFRTLAGLEPPSTANVLQARLKTPDQGDDVLQQPLLHSLVKLSDRDPHGASNARPGLSQHSGGRRGPRNLESGRKVNPLQGAKAPGIRTHSTSKRKRNECLLTRPRLLKNAIP